jgi:hypothetical protein
MRQTFYVSTHAVLAIVGATPAVRAQEGDAAHRDRHGAVHAAVMRYVL